MRKSILSGLAGIMLLAGAAPLRADFCSEFLGAFDDQGRTIVPIAIDQKTTLNEGHLPILVETSGLLPDQSAFYEGPSNSRKEINVTRHYFDGSGFKTHLGARVSKVLETSSPAEGQRHLGVWAYGLTPGSPGYFFYLRVVRTNFVDFSVVAKSCYPDFATALASRPDLNDIFNSGDPYMTTEIANLNDDAFSSVASQMSSLQSFVSISAQLESSLSTARSVRVQHRKLVRVMRRLRMLFFKPDDQINNKKFRQTLRMGKKIDSDNATSATQANSTLANL